MSIIFVCRYRQTQRMGSSVPAQTEKMRVQRIASASKKSPSGKLSKSEKGKKINKCFSPCLTAYMTRNDAIFCRKKIEREFASINESEYDFWEKHGQSFVLVTLCLFTLQVFRSDRSGFGVEKIHPISISNATCRSYTSSDNKQDVARDRGN